MRALVIEHERTAPVGLLGPWLESRGFETELLRIAETPAALHHAAGYELIVSLGSECAAYDDELPWIAAELELLRSAVGADVPVLGICFGGQLLARALGGRARRAPRPEIGWLPVRTHDARLVEEGPWLQWHFDTFLPPPGARVLAETDAGPQAYVAGSSLGVQFHPEATPEIVGGWIESFGAQLERNGIDPARLLEQTRARGCAPAISGRLFDGFLDRVAAGVNA